MTAARPGTTIPLPRFGALWFCYFAAIGAFNPYAPLWFKELGFSTLAIGTIAALQSWTRVLAPYGWGWLGDHSGQRVRLIRIGALVSLIAAAGLLVARQYYWVAACTVLLFLANGAVVPLAEAALARQLQATGEGMQRYGRVRVWGSVGFICAVLLYGWVLQVAGIAWFPALALLTYVALWVASLRVPAVRDEVAGHETAPPVLAVLRRPEVAWFFASVCLTVLAHTALYAFFSLFLDSRGFGKSTVGFLWAVSVAAEIVFFWVQARVFARASPHGWLQWASATSALRFGMIAALGDSMAALVLAQALHAITFAAQHVACIVLINHHFPGSLRGRGQALYTTLGYGIPGVVGGIGGGWLSSHFGFGAVFWAAGVAALAGWGCAWQSSRCAARAPGAGPA